MESPDGPNCHLGLHCSYCHRRELPLRQERLAVARNVPLYSFGSNLSIQFHEALFLNEIADPFLKPEERKLEKSPSTE
ncbi:hypothetical protein HHK36_027563 [Tetracentron sinense]|uniref:Uncharacterized protein n=1 Tax=Tetracentron sinense TaxID=13715 RepID=A0A834YDA5_TETSI|nr:hypothetical protein HHK36_027563 [Tetracentron sinense]